DALLRVFFLGVLSKDQALGYLTKLETDASADSAELAALDASTAWDEDSLSTYGRLATEFGYRLHAMRRDWARWAIEQLKAENRRRPSQAHPDAAAG
ncbi:MAG: hypothetical protein JO281_18150, partial [Pseudonocardiales bacterium]|nr:hypothetical protein [Pseudonocardiales bacterium]